MAPPGRSRSLGRRSNRNETADSSLIVQYFQIPANMLYSKVSTFPAGVIVFVIGTTLSLVWFTVAPITMLKKDTNKLQKMMALHKKISKEDCKTYRLNSNYTFKRAMEDDPNTWLKMNDEHCFDVEDELCLIYHSFDLLCFGFNFIFAPFLVCLLEHFLRDTIKQREWVFCTFVLGLLWFAGPALFYASKKAVLQERLDCFKSIDNVAGFEELREWLKGGCPSKCPLEREIYWLELPGVITWFYRHLIHNTTFCSLICLWKQYWTTHRNRGDVANEIQDGNEAPPTRFQYDLFLSHKKKDVADSINYSMEALARNIKEHFNGRKLKCFLDRDFHGSSWNDLPIHVKNSKTIVVLLSKTYVESPWCVLELLSAILYRRPIAFVEISTENFDLKAFKQQLKEIGFPANKLNKLDDYNNTLDFNKKYFIPSMDSIAKRLDTLESCNVSNCYSTNVTLQDVSEEFEKICKTRNSNFENKIKEKKTRSWPEWGI